MRLYVTLFLLTVTTGCLSKPDPQYFVCIGLKSENFGYSDKNLTFDVGETQSLRIDKSQKKMTFRFIESKYTKPNENWLLSSYESKEYEDKKFLLRFDTVTGELKIFEGKQSDVKDEITVNNEYTYGCNKVEKLDL